MSLPERYPGISNTRLDLLVALARVVEDAHRRGEPHANTFTSRERLAMGNVIGRFDSQPLRNHVVAREEVLAARFLKVIRTDSRRDYRTDYEAIALQERERIARQAMTTSAKETAAAMEARRAFGGYGDATKREQDAAERLRTRTENRYRTSVGYSDDDEENSDE
jgi:hypothetical protein